MSFKECMNYLKEYAKMTVFIFQEEHLSLSSVPLCVPLGDVNTETRVNPDP